MATPTRATPEQQLVQNAVIAREPAMPQPGDGGLVRVRLDLAYDGTDFNGWAMQPGLRTVEGDLGAALAQVLRLPEPPRLAVAGRTDAGVHARGQVAHVELTEAALATTPGRTGRDPFVSLRHRLTGVLGPDLVVREVSRAAPGFHARFAAVRRRYAYRICDVPSRLDPLRRREVLLVREPLDLVEMNAASEKLLGLNNFRSFCKPRERASTIRTLLGFSWTRTDDLVVGTVVADAFCHSMVRALVGVVVEVGRGRRPVEWPYQLMTAELRDPTARVVPARGLCLEEVSYPSDDLLAQRVSEARARRA